MLVYIAGKYTGDVDANIQFARQVAIEVWESGHYALTPHLNTAHFEKDCTATYEEYLAGDLRMLAVCDAILMLPDWEHSAGATKERQYALDQDIPVYVYPDLPKPNQTEVKYPEQSRMFLETVMRMYRLHLEKNCDYSPANVMGAGEVGLMTRLWDKIARLMNLTGFNLVIAGPTTYTAPKQPKNESIIDNLIDAAVYPIIWLIVRAGKWGK